MWNILLLAGGIITVLVGANLLVNGASSLAKKLKVTDLIIGLTVVAFGTSMPEFTVSVISSAQGEVDLALGNVVGSNIFNIFLILGASSAIKPLSLGNITNIDLLLVAVISLVLFFKSYDYKVSRIEGGILLLLYVAYVVYLILQG